MDIWFLFLAFAAGVLSFLSPCVLPLVPAYIGYLGGSVVRSAQARPRPSGMRNAELGMRNNNTQDPISRSQFHISDSVNASTAIAAVPPRVGSGPRSSGEGMSADRAMRPTRPVEATRRPQPNPQTKAAARWLVVSHAIVFVLAFSLVFAVIGGLVGSLRDVFLSQNTLFHTTNKRVLEYIMGALLVVFGLHMIGLINIPFLNYERRLGDKMRPGANLSYARSFLIGLGFGVGWTPCVGPTLGLIFTMAVNGQQGQAALPFIAYSLGLGVPFIVTALAMGQISSALKRFTRRGYSLQIGSWKAIDRVNIVSLISGLLLVIMGIFIFTDLVTLLAPNTPGFFNI